MLSLLHTGVAYSQASEENIETAEESTGIEEKNIKFWTFTFENDVFVGEDDGYTNGTGITVGTAGFDNFDTTNTPRWIHWLIKDSYINTAPGKKRAIAHMFFQRMQTPEEITESVFIEDDLPYAGLLAWQGSAYAWDDDVSDQLSLTLGWIGPFTLAEQSQKLIHKIVGADDPRGWRHQLQNEPVFKIELQRVWNLHRKSIGNFEYDIVGLGGFGLGTLRSAIKGGFALRLGTHLGASMGAFSLQADRHVNPLAFTAANDYYFFLGARAGYVANNVLIDGNTFTDGPSLPLDHVQDQVAAGAVWSRNRWAFVFTLSSSSSQAETASDRENFGAFSVTRRY